MNLGPLNFIQSGALPTARAIWLAVFELIWQSLKCTQKWERKMSYRIKVIKAGTSIYIDISSYVDINDVRPYFESLHHLNMQNQKVYIFFNHLLPRGKLSTTNILYDASDRSNLILILMCKQSVGNFLCKYYGTPVYNRCYP